MDLRYLKYFITVAELLNFTRAAQLLHITQPSLWLQIRKLEAEVGVSLIAREGRGIKLTAAGNVFLDQARKTLGDAEKGVAMARQAANGQIGQISIGYNAAAEFLVFPTIVPLFRRKWPMVSLNFHALTISEKLEGLRRDELDVGLNWLPVPGDEFDVQELVREPLVVLLPEDHRLAAAASVSIEDLSKEPLIAPGNPDTFQYFAQLFVQANAVMNIAYRLEQPHSMINFVAMGIGCCILADFSRNIRQKGVVYRPLRPSNAMSLGIIKKKGRGGLAEIFYRFTLDNLSSIAVKRADK